MSWFNKVDADFDLTKLIFRGISALENSQVVPSYIGHGRGKVQQTPIIWMQDRDLLLAKETDRYRFKSLSPARVAIYTPQMIAYELLDEQLFMYLASVFPPSLSKIGTNKAVEKIKNFINESLDPSHRANLLKLRSLIEMIDKIRLDNFRKKTEFKQFLDKNKHFWLTELHKFIAYARKLGLTRQAWSTNQYAVLDSMLQKMILIVDSDRGKLSQDVIDYIEGLERFLLMPISEAIKPEVDLHRTDRKGDLFYMTFYEIISHKILLDTEDNRQDFFGSPIKSVAKFHH